MMPMRANWRATKGPTAHQPGGYTESLFEILVGAAYSQLAEEWQVEPDDEERDRNDHHVAEDVHPVGAVYQGRYGHERDSTDGCSK